jgi:hypothetical protein
VAAVPRWIVAILGLSVAAQVGWQVSRGAGSAADAELAPAPGAHVLRLASFGEPEAAARLAMVHLQSYRDPDYRRLIGWLESILELDPRSQYPLFSAARVYAETSDATSSRLALDFVQRQFLRDPARRWPWLAHAALLAKHRLKDLPLARRYAADLQRLTTDPDVPLWAKQMEVFILEDMNELEAAKIMLGGLLASGRLQDPGERRFLKERLDALERRLASERRRE